MTRVTLDLTTDQFDKLHVALDHSRRTSGSVKVDRSALIALLLDHGRLVALHQGKVQEARQ